MKKSTKYVLLATGLTCSFSMILLAQQATPQSSANLHPVRGSYDLEQWGTKSKEEVVTESKRRLNKIGQSALLYAADNDSQEIDAHIFTYGNKLLVGGGYIEEDPYLWYAPLIPLSLRQQTNIGFIVYGMDFSLHEQDIFGPYKTRKVAKEIMGPKFPLLFDEWIYTSEVTHKPTSVVTLRMNGDVDLVRVSTNGKPIKD